MRKETESVIDEIARERYRQIEEEGWTLAHDDQHALGEMASAAGCYALHYSNHEHAAPPDDWPWDDHWWKPTKARRNLVKAGALIVAEIERLDRVEKEQASSDA